MTNNNTDMEQCLLHLWFGLKYRESCCVDEAIDWSQHPDELDLEELPKYIAWRTDYLQTIEHLYKLTDNSKAFYALRPWLDDATVTIKYRK